MIPHDPATPLDVDVARGLLHEMLRIRRFEEKCAELHSLTKIRGFLHLYVGEEAVAVGVMRALRPEDAVVATYREHGHALARGLSMDAVMAEMFGKIDGSSRGRVARCTSSMPGPTSTAATLSSARASRSRSAWGRGLGCRGGTA